MARFEKPLHPVAAVLEEPRDRYLWLVGRFVLEMGDVDYLLADLVGAVLGEQHPAARQAWAGSGDPLKAALTTTAAEDPALLQLLSEYDDLYQQRNYLVHGMYDGHRIHVGGEFLHGVTKLDRAKASFPDRTPFSRMEWTESQLWQLVVRAEELGNHALGAIERRRKSSPVTDLPGDAEGS